MQQIDSKYRFLRYNRLSLCTQLSLSPLPPHCEDCVYAPVVLTTTLQTTITLIHNAINLHSQKSMQAADEKWRFSPLVYLAYP